MLTFRGFRILNAEEKDQLKGELKFGPSSERLEIEEISPQQQARNVPEFDPGDCILSCHAFVNVFLRGKAKRVSIVPWGRGKGLAAPRD